MNQKGAKGRGWERQPILLHSATLPYNNSSFYPGLPLLSTSKMVAKQENSVLDPPKEYAFTAGYFNFLVVVFSPGQVLLANGEEKLLSHIAMVAKFISRICYHGNVMSHFSS